MARTAALAVSFTLLAGLLGGCASTPSSPSASSSGVPLASGSPGASASVACAATPQPATARPWWADRTFYEIFVRSFQDSDGDGTGDLKGIIDRLDYLNDGDPSTTTDLGVTGIWLMPVFEAKSYHGYDTLDYRRVERDYGSSADLKALVEAAHRRGIAVIVDLVLNHTSDQHPWFLESKDPASARAGWYIWRPTDPGYVGPDGQQVWHRLDGRWYYGIFGEAMPDLDLTNPDVTSELHDIARSWIRDTGIDGYRLDAVKHYVEDGKDQANTPQTIAWARDLRAAVRQEKPDALMVGEVWDLTSFASRYVREGALDLAFEFELADAMKRAVRLEDRSPIQGVLADVAAAYPGNAFASFLSNHDQTRTMTEVGGDRGAARAAAALLLSGPGTPFVYYGEEIGMGGRKPDERLRTPMSWTADPPAGGFSTVRPWEPMNDDWPAVNVAAQTGDGASLLSDYRRLIRLRADHPALRGPGLQVVEASDPSLVATLREGGDETLLVVVNLSSAAVTGASFSLGSGPLCGAQTAETVWLEAGAPGAVAAPTTTATGGFAGYAPVATFPARSLTVIRLAAAP